MIMHIHHIVHEENRPFSYLDFIRFEIDGQQYEMAHGTIQKLYLPLDERGIGRDSCTSQVLHSIHLEELNLV